MVSISLNLETLGTQPPAILLWLCAITFLRNNGFIKLPAQTLSLGTLKTEQPIHCSYLLNLLALGQALDLLVSVSLTRHRAYTSDLSTLLSSRGLTTLRCGISFLRVGFTLRCLQRLSVPHLATQPCLWRDN